MQLEDAETLGRTVAELRRKHHLRQDELALAAGTGLRFIHELEKGKPTLQLGKVLQALAALGIVIELKTRDGKSLPQPPPESPPRRVRRRVAPKRTARHE